MGDMFQIPDERHDTYSYSAVRLRCLLQHFDAAVVQLRNVVVCFTKLSDQHSNVLFDLPLKWAMKMLHAAEQIVETLEKEPHKYQHVRQLYQIIENIYKRRFEKMKHSAAKILWPTGFTWPTCKDLYKAWKTIDESDNYIAEKCMLVRNHPLHDEFMTNFQFSNNPVRCVLHHYIEPDVRNNYSMGEPFFVFHTEDEINAVLENFSDDEEDEDSTVPDGDETNSLAADFARTGIPMIGLVGSNEPSHLTTHESVSSFGTASSLCDDIDYIPVELGDFSHID